MTLTSACTPRVVIVGNSTRGPYSLVDASSVAIRLVSTGHLKLTRYTSTTDETGSLLVLNTDYTVGGTQDARTFTLTSAQAVLTSSQRIVAERVQAYTQDLDLTTGGAFNASSLESRFDKLAEFQQELKARVDRAIIASALDTTPSTMPLKVNATSGDLLAFDSDKNLQPVTPADIGITAVSLGTGWQTILGLPSAGTLDNLAGIRSVATYAALTALVTNTGLADNAVYYTYGRTAEEDGGEGFWRYDSASTTTANGGTILAIDGGGAGRFFRLFSERYSVRWFGAKGDNSTDDLTALNSTYTAVYAAGGGTIFLPRGYYRVTGEWAIGAKQYSSLAFLENRTGPIGDGTFTSNSIGASTTINEANPGRGISVEFDDGAFLVADFSPAGPTPVLGYYLEGAYRARGSIKNAKIVSAAMISGGVYNFNAVAAPQTNNLIGLLFRRGAAVVERTHISGCEHGIIGAQAYWTRLSDTVVEWAGGVCLDMITANAITVENILMWYSNKGVVFDGGASSIRGIHTEQVANELYIFGSDCCVFGPGYLEDVSVDTGSGYAVTLGVTENGNEVIDTQFIGLRVGSARPSKGAFRVWATRSAVFTNCRAYSKTVLYDVQSNGAHFNNDWYPTTDKWLVTSSGIYKSASVHPGTDRVVQGPWYFTATGIAPGLIAAGASADYDYSLPGDFSDSGIHTAFATYTSGGSALLTVTARTVAGPKVRLTFANPSAAGINPGSFNMAIIVFDGR